MFKKLIPLLIPFALNAQCPKNNVPFTHKEFRNLVHYFSSKEELKTYFDFKAGDIIADIGAGEGKYEGALSLLYDSLTFYVQDLDSNILNQKALNKVIRHYTKLKGCEQSNKFNLCIGSEKTSNLPNETFDKVISFSSVHEFTYMDEMIADLYKKLKPGGKIFIADAPCTKKGHKNRKPEEISEIMRKHGFTQLQMHIVNSNYLEPVYRAVFVK